MPDATIEAVDLTKRFGTRTAVDGLTFTARPGEVLGLLGPNGAGKTTTIRLLTTMLAPTAGRFSIAGIPGTEPGAIRSLIGVLPESAGYPGQQTGNTYLSYYARLFGRSRADAARLADRLLDEVGLGERAGSRVATYSRGMKQRLGIARALVNDPVVVFLDEPTLGLDPAGQRQVLDIVREVAGRRGATVVLSTHTLPDVEEVCSTVLILMRGRMLDAGSVSAVSALAAAPRSAQLRVPVELLGAARHAITDGPGLRVDGVEGRPDLLRVSATTGEVASANELNAALRAVLAAGVPVLGYEVDGGRLNDAFLAMTKEGSR